jgi:hypothetical protein
MSKCAHVYPGLATIRPSVLLPPFLDTVQGIYSAYKFAFYQICSTFKICVATISMAWKTKTNMASRFENERKSLNIFSILHWTALKYIIP